MVFFPWATIVFAAAAAAWTSPIFAAFDAVVPPLATLVIALLPALMPAFVTLTVFVGSAFVIVKPVVSSIGFYYAHPSIIDCGIACFNTAVFA